MEKEFTIKDFSNERTVYLTGEINDDSVLQLKKDIETIVVADKDIYDENIKILNNVSPVVKEAYENNIKIPPIVLDVVSPGGSVYSGLAIYDTIRDYNLNSKHKIIAKATGMVASAATIVFLACDERLAGKNTTFLIHSVSNIVLGKLQDIEDDLDETKRLAEILKNIYVERTNISYDKLEEIDKLKKDWVLTADDAKKYNIVTDIF